MKRRNEAQIFTINQPAQKVYSDKKIYEIVRFF